MALGFQNQKFKKKQINPPPPAPIQTKQNNMITYCLLLTYYSTI